MFCTPLIIAQWRQTHGARQTHRVGFILHMVATISLSFPWDFSAISLSFHWKVNSKIIFFNEPQNSLLYQHCLGSQRFEGFPGTKSHKRQKKKLLLCVTVKVLSLWAFCGSTRCPRRKQNRKAGLPIQTPGSDDSVKSIARARASACSGRWRNHASHGAEFGNVFYIRDIELPSFGGALLLIKSFCFLYGFKVL